MAFKLIIVVVPCVVTFFLGILSERVINRKRLDLNIEGSCGNINATIVNTGRVPFAVQELQVNLSKSPSDDEEAGLLVRFLEKLLSRKIAQLLMTKKKVLISKLLPKKIKQWYGKRVMLKMAETIKFLGYIFPKQGRIYTIAPGDSKFIEIPTAQIIATMDFLNSDKSSLMVYLSCKLVGDEKIRYCLPIFCGFTSSSLSGREITLPIFVSMEF